MSTHPNDRPRHGLARTAVIVMLTVLAALPAIAAEAQRAPGRTGSDLPVGFGFAGSSGDAGRPTGRTGGVLSRSARGTTDTIRGIDVSHYQGSIDWSRVADRDKRFAYMKSTDDVDYADPTFVFNRAEAKANGIAVGAYHFARPDRRTGDAAREARWFVERTNPKPGELLPVLDIEWNDHHLSQTEMTDWALRWVEEVRDLTGVTAMVYTSPHGWYERFGDTKRLARAGSPLWVAHWGVSSPLVPADDWDGNGWVVWQYSSKGSVAGIEHRVDLDRLAPGTTLGRLTIRKLSLDVHGGAGVVTSDPAGLGCAANCERNVDPDTVVTLTAVPDDNAFFSGWGGDCAGGGTTCTVTMKGNRSVTAEFVTDITPPQASISSPDELMDPARVVFDEPVRGVTPSNVILRRSGHGGVAVARTCRSGAGAPVPCATGKVRTVVLRPTPPLVPGRSYETVVNPAGADPVADLVGNPAAITVLPFVGQPTVDQDQMPFEHEWRVVHSGTALGGSFLVERLPDAELSFDFKGRSVTWYTVMGPAYGRAQVIVDGRPERAVDLWAEQYRAHVQRRLDGLGAGAHTITIVATGHARPRATDRLVAVDGFGTESRGTLRSPVTVQRWRTVDAPSAFRGSYAAADLSGAALTLGFDGVGVDLTTVTGPNRGRLRVWVDDAVVDVFDLWSASPTFDVVHHIDGLDDAFHILRLEATGTARTGATGSLVAIDRIDVLPGP